MDLTIGPATTALVLLAALLHASWNAIVRSDQDPLATTVLLTASAGCVSLAVLFWLPLPLAPSWPFLAASVAIHVLYFWLLSSAYRAGDLIEVYPVARGAAPLIVLIIAIAIVGENLSAYSVFAVLVIILGILVLAFKGRRLAMVRRRPVLFALATAVSIAAYTIVDGLGARAAGSPHGYTASMFALNGICFAALFGWRGKRAIRAMSTRQWVMATGAGILSLAAYWVVIWAMVRSPIAPIAALRETSIVFAAIIGAVLLKEGLGRWRIVAVVLVATGVALLQLFR